MTRRVVDVGGLPDHAFGHRGLIWWGTVSFMVIEGTMLFMMIVAYFYLRGRVAQWPPSLPDPIATFGTINTLVMLASLLPNHLAKRAAERYDLGRVRAWLSVTCVFGLVFIVVRTFEFGSLGSRWDSNAYGSIVWMTMGLHTAHVVTDVIDSLVLAALMFTRHVEPRRLVDVSENALYWDFIVLTWLPIYAVIYFGPRFL
jgi:heme/copper-type cytochrome/quinol oxidase subunit 3